jgi:NADH dehydrogenase [ubiquinone] 1 alpha subcomplex assembly factor 5
MASIASLSLGRRQRTSTAVADLFDMKARALRRNRAARIGPELFLFERAFDDCLERLALIRRRFQQAMLIGCPDAWPERLREFADEVEAAGDCWEPVEAAYDLVLSIGTLDTENDLRLALQLVRHAMQPGALFLGAVAGGETLPQLRNALRAADAVTGAAAPHVHPRVEASALAPLLAEAGFIDPVVDVDRAIVSYRSFDRLIGDLRAMGATNVLTARPRFIGRAARAAATAAFRQAGDGTRTAETFEILHFAAWTPAKD